MLDSRTSLTGFWTTIFTLTAFLLSVLVGASILLVFWGAYRSAPSEVQVFRDAVESSIRENESHDKQVARAQRMDDKLRLDHLLRDIRTEADNLREALDKLLVSEDDTRLTIFSKLLWFVWRRDLEDRVRRLDMLRMRFLVSYMGIVSAGDAGGQDKKKNTTTIMDPEKAALSRSLTEGLSAARTQPPKSLMEAIRARPPLRRLTTQAIGHSESVEGEQRTGWAGVIRELQLSPRMHKRHASVENALARSLESSPSP